MTSAGYKCMTWKTVATSFLLLRLKLIASAEVICENAKAFGMPFKTCAYAFAFSDIDLPRKVSE